MQEHEKFLILSKNDTPTHLAAGHFEKNEQKLSKNESNDAHICKIWTKYFMYILSIPKFGIVYAFSQRLKKKIQLGRIS